jgi:hypothetical protein
MAFKYATWKPNQAPVPANERPFDPCAPILESASFVPLNKLNMDMIHRRKEDIDEAYKAHASEARLNKSDPKYMPIVKRVKLGMTGIKINLQRRQEEDHQIKMMVTWDFRRLTTARGAWDPLQQMYGITEGQQRVSALRNKIMRGDLIEYGWNPEDWENFEINLEIVELEIVNGIVDYGPECKTYIQENSEKLAMSHADKFKAEVMGKDKYAPDKETYPEFEQASKVYKLMQQFGITAHNKDSQWENYPGVCTQIKFLRADKGKNTTLPLGDLKTIFELHNENSKDQPLISIEFLPMLFLEKMIKDHGSFDINDPKKVKEKEKFYRYMNALVHKGFSGWKIYMNFAESIYKKRAPGESIPKNWSLIFLLQLLQAAGYTYPDIDQSVYTMYGAPTGWSKMTPAERSKVKE